MARNHYGSLKHQISQRLKSLNRIGEKKHAAKLEEKERCYSARERWNPARVEGIHGAKTMEHYTKIGHRWATWAKENVPDLVKGRQISEMQEAAAAYIKAREAEGLTNWTLKQDRSALAKIIGTPGRDICYLPPRRKEDRVKNTKMPKEFSESRNRDLVDICKATGIRHHEVAQLTPAHLSAHDGRLILKDIIGKGGKIRDVIILRDSEERVIEIFQGKAPGEQIITKIPIRTPCHIYRREYVAARDKELIAAGVKSQTMRDEIITKDLGHNRRDVIQTSYR